MANDILLAIGANLTSSVGPPVMTVKAACRELEKYGAAIRGMSALYNTPAFPLGNGPDFVNAAARISVDWSLQETLEICHKIEASMDRVRETRWGQRTLDIDVIGCGTSVLPDTQTYEFWADLSLEDQKAQAPAELIVPHPRVHDRAFVLVPLADVAPDWVHPVLGRSVLQMRDALDPALLQEVRRIE